MRTTNTKFPGQFSEDEKTLDAMLAYGITPSRDLVALQARANDDAARRASRSGVSAMTYETAVADAHEALTGLAADLAGTTPRKSLKDMLTHKDRLRGLGILLIALALVGLVVDYIMNPALGASS